MNNWPFPNKLLFINESIIWYSGNSIWSQNGNRFFSIMSQAIIGKLTSTFASFECVRCFANNEAAAAALLTCVVISRLHVRIRRSTDTRDGRSRRGGGRSRGHLVHVYASLYTSIGGYKVINIERIILFRRSRLHLKTSVTGLLHWPRHNWSLHWHCQC